MRRLKPGSKGLLTAIRRNLGSARRVEVLLSGPETPVEIDTPRGQALDVGLSGGAPE